MKIKIILIIFIFFSPKITFANELLVSSNGIKLGDSALKYFDQNLIESKKKFIYKSDEYFMIYVQGEQINIKNNDANYTIVSIKGGQKMGFEECKKEIIKLIAEIKALVPNVKTKENGSADNPRKHGGDPSGKSLTFGLDFYLNESPKDGPVIRTNCTDWSSEFETSRNFVDHLGKTIILKEFNLFLIKMFSGG
jgi:hypothetical protein